MLRIAPDATSGEIRAAYRALAFSHHPDRATQAAAGEYPNDSMADINAAWQVLGDPAKRYDYDRKRHQGETTSAATAWVSSNPADEGPPIVEGPARPINFTMAIAGVLPWIALVLALGAIFIFTAYAGGSDDGPSGATGSNGSTAVRDIRGSCVQQSGGFTLIVNCAATPHEGQIVAQASLGASCPNQTVAWAIPQQNVLACTDPTTAVP